jgi:hypothetical protein
MRAGKSEPSQIMIERRVAPCRRSMAGLARRAETAGVGVLAQVAPDAIGRRSDVAPTGMTGAARQPAVAGLEEETGPDVIEAHLPPSGRGMATGAIFVELPGVGIVVAMAPGAGQRKPGPLPIDVAGVAGRDPVPTGQQESGSSMIDLRRIPTGRFVALAAVDAQSAEMDVIALMAGETNGRSHS